MGDVNKKGTLIKDQKWSELRKMREDSEVTRISRFSGRVLEEYVEGNLIHKSRLEDSSIDKDHKPNAELIEPLQE